MSVTTPDHDWDFRITSENDPITTSIGTHEAGVFDYISNKAAVYKSSGSTQSSNTTDGVVNSSTNWIDIGALTYGTNVSVEMYLKGTGTATSGATIFNITKYESSVYDELYVNFADTTGNVGYVQQVAGTSSSGTLSNTVIPRNNSGYNHFVVTIDGTTLKTYLDGVLKDTATITSFSGERSNFYLGANRSTITNTGNEMNIKYCRLWKNNTLSSSNVTYLNTNKDTNYLFRTTPPPLPKNSWDFRVSTPSSNIVYDEVSNAAATYINNTISDTTDGATFTFLDDNNSSANTTGDYIQLDKYDWKTNNWSIEMYAYITDHQQYDALFSFATNTSNTYKMEVGFNNLTTTSDAANPLRLLYYNEVFGGSSVVNTFTAKETTVVRNAWNHYVYTYNSDSQVLSVMINGNIRFYVTGLVPDTSSATDILVSDLTTSSPTFVIGSGGRSGIGMKTKYFRIWNGTMISEVQALKLYELRETSHIYSNVSSLLTLGYSHSEIINTFGKTLPDYQAANIPIADTPFASFSTVNKYKQTYFKNMLDISGEFVHRKHTFIGDISFNNDLSINNVMIVNNDLSFNKGLIVNGDASFNGNVNVTGDITLNGTLKLKDNTIETSKLDFTIIENEGTFDTSQDVSLNSTFTIQGDFDKYLDNSGNFQTDFSENIVLIPSSLGLDLSGGSATLSGKTGDQAFLNGTYIVKDNSGNTTGNIYDDLHENTAENNLTSLPKNWNSLQVNSRGNWVYDGSSNYTSYLDEYGRPQTVKGDNYDLTLPFHFYPSKAFLRTIPILPASSSINPHNYPASVKFLGATNTPNSSYDIDTTPTFNWDFRTNVDASGVVIDSISQNKATINDTFCTEGQGLICNNLGDKATFEPFLTSDVANTVEMFCYHLRNDSTKSAYWFNIVDTEDSKGAGYIAHRIRQNGENDFYINGVTVGSTYTYPNAPDVDAVNHIVMTTTSTTAKCYLNGSLVGSTTHSESLVAGTHAYNSIGNRGSDTSQLYGNIYYVRFWNGTEITANQVSALYNNRYNIYLYKNIGPSKYHLLGEFSNKATTVIADSSANYPYNSVVYLTGLPTAVYAWDFRVATSTSITDTIQNVTATYVNTTSTVEDGLAYTGVASHATIPSGILVGGGAQDISLEIYFKYTAALGGWGHIFDMQLSDGDWTRLTQMGTQGHFTWVYGSMSGFTTNREITNLSASALVDTWIHLIATIEYPSDYTTSGTTARFYHNGSLINTTTGGPYSTSTTPSTTTDHIGRNPDSSVQDSTGNIRYMRWYNKQLSEDEVTSLYNKRDKTLLLDGISQNYIHGADFLYDLNRKYYINQLRMIVDQAPDSSGNSYGEYNIDKLAYSGSSFSGKKLENSYPNLYLNTAAHDISYGFTEDHTNIVYDLSHNKNQLPIIDMSGGGGIHIAPREISIQDGSLNTINIHKPTIKNTYSKPTYAENTYSSVAPATDASFNTEFYSHFGARDASGHFNKRISQDGKTIATLQNRGYQAYDVSNAEVVFSTDYGKNWKNILRDCSNSFLFTENDISYGLLFATGDVSGAIDIATSSNGQTMYVGRHRNWVSDEISYSGLGAKAAVYSTIPISSSGFPQSILETTIPFVNNSGLSATLSGSSTHSSFDGDYTFSTSSNMFIARPAGTTSGSGYYAPYYWFKDYFNTGYSNHGDFLVTIGTGTGEWTYVNGDAQYNYGNFQYFAVPNDNAVTWYDTAGNATTENMGVMTLSFPSTLRIKLTSISMQLYSRILGMRILGTEEDGTIRNLGTVNTEAGPAGYTSYHKIDLTCNNPITNIMFGVTKIEGGPNYLRIHHFFFEGTYLSSAASPGVPITNGLPEIYSTNYGNSWKLSPFKYHKGPTIISGDGSTILLLQESKLDNTKHAYATISGHGNNNPYVDTHWITTDYGSNWNTLNRSGYDMSNNVIPPSYGSKTATFMKSCMSYTGQYIYIYNVQCTTNNNYGELYYSHDYGNTWNKWTTVEAQNYIASGNALAGSGQILCSGNGKYVFIAGQAAGTSRLSEAIYYRSTDYGVTFNKDITTFPWQEGSSGEDSTSRGPFVSYEGDLIVISNTHYNYLDDSSANQLYSSTTDAGIKYSLDYGVNYNVLDLSGESLYNATTNFSTLPNKTNKNLSSLFSTKGDIFSNCPGPNDYSFLTSVMGGNTTDASFVFLQSIKFPKDKVSTTVEKEGPVITTYEEPIDTENDFGNITNTTTLTSGVSYYSSAISEDGQVLLSAGATDVSNGNYYGGYNLTNAKFPPTENVVEYITPSFNVLQPTHDWDFRVAGLSTVVDSISSVNANCSRTTDATNGFVCSNYSQHVETDTFTFGGGDLTMEFYWEADSFNRNSRTRTNFLLDFTPQSSTQGWESLQFVINDDNGTVEEARVKIYEDSSIVTAYNESSWTASASTTHHVVFTVKTLSATSFQTTAYFDGVQVDQDTITTPYPTLQESSTFLHMCNREDLDANRYYPGEYYYARIWNGTALTADDAATLYNNRTSSSATLASSWVDTPTPVPSHFKTAQLSYNGNYAMAIPYGITQTNAQYLYYWSASGDFHRFDGNYLSNFDAENWKFGKLSGNGNFFVGFTHSSTTLSDASYNSTTWWQDKVSNTMIIYKNLYTIPRGTVSDSDATTYGQGTTYDLNTAFSTDSGVTEYYITSVHVSETGQYVLFVGGSSDTTLTNRCAFSKDFGVTFTNITSLFSFTDITKPLVYCHVSDNGRYLFISQYNSSEYCFSTDYGASFTLHNTFPSSTKTYGVVSKDGQNALFVDTNKYVYVSVNGNFRQEVIPSLSGTNTNLSLNHNYWKYKSTTGEITYNPSMPNIKYLVGTANNIIETSGSITAPTHSYEFRLARSSSVSDQMGTGGTATYEGGSVSTTTDGVVLDNTDNSNGPKYVNITPPTISDSTHSIEIYFKLTTDIASFAMATSMVASDNKEHWISTTGSADNQFQNNNASSGIDAVYNTTNPTAGETYHAVVSATKNGNVVFYINNAYTNTGTVTTFSYTPTAWNLGRRANNGTNYADITVYYVRWWDGHALSSSEVSYLYTNRADSTFISSIGLSSSNVRYTESYFSELDIKGSLTNLSGTAYTSSDYRVKENVRDLENSDTIASLAPISYTQNNLHHKKSIGFLAHEFAESFPDLVDGTKDGPEMQSINYNGIIAVLIKEIQTLRTKINKLKSEI